MYLYLSLAILLLLYFRKRVLQFVFMFSFPLFEKYENFGKLLGIQYKRSDEWATTRKTSGLLLYLPRFLSNITGVEFHLGEIDFIKSFKQRQRTPVADFKIDLEKGERTLADLEREIIRIWHFQLKKNYELPINDEDDELMIEYMLGERRDVAAGHSSFIQKMKGYASLFLDKEKHTRKKNAMRNFTDEEKLLYKVPFLTTVDTFILCLSFKAYGTELSDFFDRLPVKFLPMYENDNTILLRLENNKKNNPANSVFGPSGVVCPGSHVTTQIIESIKDFCNTHEWEIIGEPKQPRSMLAGICNMNEVSINIR